MNQKSLLRNDGILPATETAAQINPYPNSSFKKYSVITFVFFHSLPPALQTITFPPNHFLFPPIQVVAGRGLLFISF